MSIAVIGGKLYINKPKNMNHVHKSSKDLVFVMINLGTNISGGDTLFYGRVKQKDFGKRAHVLKQILSRIIMGTIEIRFYEVCLWRVHRTVRINYITVLCTLQRETS